jgi:hypothetical protein
LHWWPKGANFLIEIKYHLLRSLFTSGLHTKRTTLFDQFDGGSENRNYGNFVLSSDVFNEVATNFHTDMLGDDDVTVPDRVDDEDTGIAGFEGSRLITAHCHNEGDAKITAPRKAYENTACICLGDVVKAMLSESHGEKKPIVVIVRDIHDWNSRAKAVKSPYLKHMGSPLVWKQVKSSTPPGFVYRTSDWLGADGVVDGRPVKLFAAGNYPIKEPPSLFPDLQILSLSPPLTQQKRRLRNCARAVQMSPHSLRLFCLLVATTHRWAFSTRANLSQARLGLVEAYQQATVGLCLSMLRCRP